MQYWGVTPDQVTVNIGHEITLSRPDGSHAHIPINGSGQFVVNYRARTEDFQAMGYSLMGKGLSDKTNNQPSPERDHLPPLKDNIVVVGVTLAGTPPPRMPGPIPHRFLFTPGHRPPQRHEQHSPGGLSPLRQYLGVADDLCAHHLRSWKCSCCA